MSRLAALESALARHGPDAIANIDLHGLASEIAEKAGREESTDADYCDALIEAERRLEDPSRCPKCGNGAPAYDPPYCAACPTPGGEGAEG